MLVCWYLARLIWPWRWKRYIPPNRRLTFNGLHGVISRPPLWEPKISHKWMTIFASSDWQRTGEAIHVGPSTDASWQLNWQLQLVYRQLPSSLWGFKGQKDTCSWRCIKAVSMFAGIRLTPRVPCHVMNLDWFWVLIGSQFCSHAFRVSDCLLYWFNQIRVLRGKWRNRVET
jgi:hypothetical protein